jgi:hypothetical protein
MRLLSELNGKFPRISYSSSLPAAFWIFAESSSLSKREKPRESANLTRATSSGEEA